MQTKLPSHLKNKIADYRHQKKAYLSVAIDALGNSAISIDWEVTDSQLGMGSKLEQGDNSQGVQHGLRKG